MIDQRTLVLDIETAGEEFDKMDATTQEEVTKVFKTDPSDKEAYQIELEKTLALSPMLGQTVVLGVYDVEKNIAKVNFDPGSAEGKEFKEDNMTFTPMQEKEMLERFWSGVKNYTHIVTFNGRGFDMPYLIVRSAIHGVQPTVDLMGYRYISNRQSPPYHIDLLDQFKYYGAAFYKSSLHLATRAFGITSPKDDGISGQDVTRFFREGKCEEIARYNGRDIIATAELYKRWNEYMNMIL